VFTGGHVCTGAAFAHGGNRPQQAGDTGRSMAVVDVGGVTAAADAAGVATTAVCGLSASVTLGELSGLIASRTPLTHVRVQSMAPLLYSCAMYDEPLALTLLRLGVGVDIDICDTSGYTALHYAADAGLVGLARELLRAGCATDRRTDDIESPYGPPVVGGKTALHLAAARGDEELVGLLLGHDPSLAAALDTDGNTAFRLGCMHGHPDLRLRAEKAADAADQLDEEALLAKRQADQAAATARLALLNQPQGALLEVHAERGLWNEAECAHWLRVLELTVQPPGEGGSGGAGAGGRQWHTSRHTAHATTDLPAAELPMEQYRLLVAQVEARVFPKLALHYNRDSPADGGAVRSYSFRDLFFVKYEVRKGEQTSLAVHADGSLLSFNLLLNRPQEFEGGGTFFERTGNTYALGQGDVLLHCGRLRHAAAPITAGRRLLLVGFVDVR
jgi:predicted 2-oxoglutarate/Fe(II)-dependent dioxygenase YbiX